MREVEGESYQTIIDVLCSIMRPYLVASSADEDENSNKM